MKFRIENKFLTQKIIFFQKLQTLNLFRNHFQLNNSSKSDENQKNST